MHHGVECRPTLPAQKIRSASLITAVYLCPGTCTRGPRAETQRKIFVSVVHSSSGHDESVLLFGPDQHVPVRLSRTQQQKESGCSSMESRKGHNVTPCPGSLRNNRRNVSACVQHLNSLKPGAKLGQNPLELLPLVIMMRTQNTYKLLNTFTVGKLWTQHRTKGQEIHRGGAIIDPASH